jgi:hypothetical protein
MKNSKCNKHTKYKRVWVVLPWASEVSGLTPKQIKIFNTWKEAVNYADFHTNHMQALFLKRLKVL